MVEPVCGAQRSHRKRRASYIMLIFESKGKNLHWSVHPTASTVETVTESWKVVSASPETALRETELGKQVLEREF